MHVRKQVRNRFTSVLGSIPALDSHVYENRTYELRKEELPAALIFSGPEVIEKATQARTAIQKRKIQTEVYIFDRDAENIGDAIDEHAAAVEAAVFADPTLGGLASETVLLDAVPYIDAESDIPVGALRMTFQSTVFTREGVPDKAIQQ